MAGTTGPVRTGASAVVQDRPEPIDVVATDGRMLVDHHAGDRLTLVPSAEPGLGLVQTQALLAHDPADGPGE